MRGRSHRPTQRDNETTTIQSQLIVGKVVTGRVAEVTFAQCATCTKTLRSAQDTIEAHPKIAARLGTDSAVHRLESSLGALEALAAIEAARSTTTTTGRPPPPIMGEGSAILRARRVIGSRPSAGLTDWQIDALINHLTAPGVLAKWLARFAPSRTEFARFDSCAVKPWAHLTVGRDDRGNESPLLSGLR